MLSYYLLKCHTILYLYWFAYFINKVDLCPEEMGNNVRPVVALLGDISAIVSQVSALSN